MTLIRALCLTVLLLGAGLTQAANVQYITDQMEVTLRSGTSTKHQILRMLPTGSAVTVLEHDAEAGYSKIRTQSGSEGWVLSRYLMQTAPARLQLESAEKKLQQLQSTTERLQQELAALKTEKTSTEQERNRLNDQTGRLSRELAEIKNISANAVRIAEEGRQLKQQAADLDRENQLLRQENESLKDRSRRDWFVVGAIVVVSSMLFGILLTRIRWRRRSSWGDL